MSDETTEVKVEEGAEMPVVETPEVETETTPVEETPAAE